MPPLRLGVSLQPRWPLDDGTAALRAAGHAEALGFDHVAVGNRLLDSGFGLDTDPLVLLSAVAGATTRLRLLTSVLVAPTIRRWCPPTRPPPWTSCPAAG
jgi:alkanesulfonate monooxygenase SsuD/methylene tetrahydromethanopterin reductase-like flavin-dependent oxidoreductase (luciferase family)